MIYSIYGTIHNINIAGLEPATCIVTGLKPITTEPSTPHNRLKFGIKFRNKSVVNQ